MQLSDEELVSLFTKCSKEARSWREWTGIGSLYQSLLVEDLVTVTKIEFLESHVPYHAAVFHYIVLVYLQVS